MSQLSRKLRSASHGGLMFWCAGCDAPHRVNVGTGDGPRWTWNGEVELPTFTPSVLVTWNQGNPPSPQACHSFVTDGRIQYLSDCTHALAGQTVELADWPEWWER